MKTVFGFFLRLFVSFVAAKFILVAINLDRRDYLLWLTGLFTANIYLITLLGYRDRIFHHHRTPEGPPMEPSPTEPEATSPPPPP